MPANISPYAREVGTSDLVISVVSPPAPALYASMHVIDDSTTEESEWGKQTQGKGEFNARCFVSELGYEQVFSKGHSP